MHTIRRSALFAIAIVMAIIVSCGCGKKGAVSADTIYSGDAASCKIVRPTVNYEVNPIGIEHKPVFGWRMESDEDGQAQTAYRIVVSSSQKEMDSGIFVWDSKKVESDISAAIPYAGDALETGKNYVWKVYVWTKEGGMSESADGASFEMGLTDNDWSGASWIGVRKPGRSYTAYDADYTIEYDVRLGKTYSGFVWGMDTNQYGEYFRCDFNTIGENIEFSITEISDSGENVDKVILNERFPELFGDVEAFCENAHHVTLYVKGKTVNASVDNKHVFEVNLGADKPPANIGLWTARGTFYAYYDNIVLNDKNSKSVISEDFEQEGNNIFSPHYTKISDGWCKASSGFILMSGTDEPAPMLRRSFAKDSGSKILSARLYAASLGDYRIYLNGNDICGEYLSAGRALYNEEAYYRTYDVTKFFGDDRDENVIGAVIGHGRYNKANSEWGKNIAFCAKLVIKYEDGSVQTVLTDNAWKAFSDGPIRNDDMFLGECYDAAKEQDGWCEAGYDDAKWNDVDLFPEHDKLRKIAAEAPAVKRVEERSPVSLSEPVKGEYVYDFGQNFNGNCMITLRNTKSRRGQTVTIRYAEALNDENMSCKDDETGTIWTQNLYMADNTDYYTMSGQGDETYTPILVCRGFRYVQISGLDEPVPIEDISGIVISADNKRTGYFECSDENVNRLYESIYWTQLSNYLDVPIDCPQRDERFGWTGDAQVFANTAAYNADVYSYINKYLDLLIRCRDENGVFPEIVPAKAPDTASNGWSDAGIILAWELYQQYGNKDIIAENLSAMCRYMDHLADTSNDYVRSQRDFSDHNAVSALDDDIANTAQCAYVAKLLSKMSLCIGENDIALKYEDMYNKYRKAWQDNYINEDGSIDCWLQSAYTLGLAYGLYPEELEEEGARCLNNAIIANDYHLNTGYIATQFLLPILCKYGYADTAYRILRQDTYPSWNNMLSRNQTTIAEAWYTCYNTEEGKYAINGSLNHPALGSVGQWIYSGILGIRRDEDSPAYKHFYIEPVVGGGLTYARGSYESVYGMIESAWRADGNELVFEFAIPPNTTATVSLPDAKYRNMELGSGKHEYRISLRN